MSLKNLCDTLRKVRRLENCFNFVKIYYYKEQSYSVSPSVNSKDVGKVLFMS
jgi:hypothetical protein